MTVACPVVLYGMTYLFAASPVAATAQTGNVQVEAIVQQFATGVMTDLFDDGSFAVYDAVTLKLISPAELAGQSIRVHVSQGREPANSPLRNPGRRCRFELDKNLLTSAVIFRGALENLQWLDESKPVTAPRRNDHLRPIDAKLRAAIEQELARLDEQAQREAGPDLPRASTQIAYYLLAGLAAQGAVLENLPEAEQRLFEVQPRGGGRARLVSVYADVRVVLTEGTIQDKSGSYVLKSVCGN